jgi:hypothetical protein
MQTKSFSLLILTWLGSIALVYFFLYQTGFIATLPNAENLIAWDASWYQSIFQKGYEYIHMQSCNAGFFPFFAVVWGLLGGSSIGISIVNLLIFVASLQYLIRIYQPSFQESLLLLTLPPMFFFYVPYSESLFFLFSSILLYGIKKDNDILVALAIFFASLTRPSFLFFVPVFSFLFLMDFEKEKFGFLLKKYFLYYALPTIVALGIIIIVQKMQTDVWLAYFKTQHNVWSRGFRLPTLPFGSTEGLSLLWIESISFWMGIGLTIFASYFTISLFRNRLILLKYDRTFIFSSLFLTMSFMSIVFFNPVWEIDRTILNGINRYMFANPFLFVFMWEITKRSKIKKQHFFYLLILSFFVWTLVDYYYLSMERIFYFVSITAYLLLYVFFVQNKNRLVFSILFLLNILGQAYLLSRFVGNEWVG